MNGEKEDASTVEELFDQVPPEHHDAVRKLFEAADRPMAPGDPRRHHFVPQFYLRRFADGDGRLGVIDLHKPKARRTATVGDVAVIKDFYTVVHTKGHDTTIVESVLAEIDGQAARLISRVAHGVIPLAGLDRFHFSLWLAMQAVRGPGPRRQMEAFGATMAKFEIAMGATRERARRTLAERDGAEPSEAQIEALLEAARRGAPGVDIVVPQNALVPAMLKLGFDTGVFLYERQWTILHTEAPGVLTSDQPIALYTEPQNRQPFEGIGIATADEILVPLDRSHVLVAHELHDFPTGILRVRGAELADLNRQIVQFAHGEVYGHPDDIGRTSTKLLPSPDRPVAHIDGGFIRNVDLPDGMNRTPSRPRPRRYRDSQ